MDQIMNENTNDLDIQIEVRAVEIPASEYRKLIGMEAKIDTVIRYAANHDNYDVRTFFKEVFAEEILRKRTELHIKEDPDE